MESVKTDDTAIPYFAWDRNLTVGAIKAVLKSDNGYERNRTTAWIMREAAFADVWQFLDPRKVRDNFSELEPLLGRRKAFWQYIIGKWHELGKF
ncbi:MAG: hypothetical protein WC340_11205 [Kiritimatiellia bacterium]